MNVKKIVIDGKTYNSVDEMPEDVRRNYEEAVRNFGATANSAINPNQPLNDVFADANDNGMPDIMENMGNQVINMTSSMSFVVDGKVYQSIDELPPQAREKYEQAMGSIDKNRNGLPDFLEGMMNVSHPQQPMMSVTSYPTETDTTRHASRAPMSVSPTITPDTSNGWMLALGGLFIFLMCALGAIGVWYFFIR